MYVCTFNLIEIFHLFISQVIVHSTLTSFILDSTVMNSAISGAASRLKHSSTWPSE